MILLLLTITTVKAQNLIVNGDFEFFQKCPDGVGKVDGYLKQVTVPTAGTSDYFNECSSGKNNVPRNFRGVQEPKSGKGYVGFYAYAPNYYKEYIQLPLKQALEPNKEYRLHFFVSLAEDSQYTVKSLGALFTEKEMSLNTKTNIRLRELGPKYGHFHYENMKIAGSLTNTEDWVLVELDFIATGFEKYLTLGSFSKGGSADLVKLNNPKPGSANLGYFYLDDVQLNAKSEFEELRYDHIFVLENVNFDDDSHILDAESKMYLNKLFDTLTNPGQDKVVLKGHTDNVGNSTYNELLSRRRVDNVADYLVELGVPQENITVEAYGEKLPISNGLDNESRQKNRRVEFVITEFEEF